MGCENDDKQLKDLFEKRIMVEEATDIVSHISQDGRRKASLKAPLMLRYQADTVYIDFPKSLHVDFYDLNEKRESYLDAKTGKYFESLNKVLLRDSVVFISLKGDTLRTVELWWNQETKKIYTDSTVQIHTINKQIYGGRGFEAMQDFSQRIIKYPTGMMYVSDSLQ